MTALTEHFGAPPAKPPDSPWRALWAMMVGFFMILVDSTIVAVANPRIMEKLDTDYAAVIWVTSAYLLAYAVPLLVAGRLGDRFGPKNLYLIGLAIFTAASLWCGLSGSIGMLITARVVQGLGAGLLTPQTLSMITRIFPAERRGVAMSVWGATAGVATLVGPLAGGVLVDSLGWQWIFFVNVPVGIVGIALAVWLIPVLPTDQHRFDVLGVLLSGVAMFLIVFGLQEGQSHHWSLWIWGTIAGGVAVMGAFVYWQRVNKNEPLVPLRVFSDRDFSLSNAAIAVMGFVVVAMVLPLMFYLQAVCGLSPTRSALVMAPTAVVTGLLAPAVGRIVDRSHPRPIVGFGFATLAIALTWLSIEMTPTTPMWRLVLPFAAMGVGMAFIWAPLAATATRNLPPDLAGAGSGVYNATRQVGSVLGSASMAAFMTWRIGDELPPLPDGAAPRGEGAVTQLPAFLHPTVLGRDVSVDAAACLRRVVRCRGGAVPSRRPIGARRCASGAAGFGEADDDDFDDFEPRTDEIPAIDEQYLLDEYGAIFDDEHELRRVCLPSRRRSRPPMSRLPRHRTTVTPNRWPFAPILATSSWCSFSRRSPTNRSTTIRRTAGCTSSAEPIGFAHNGFHVDREQPFRDVSSQPPSRGRHAARSEPGDDWMDPDADSYGRHSMPAGD